jgi:hypothetical protein
MPSKKKTPLASHAESTGGRYPEKPKDLETPKTTKYKKQRAIPKVTAKAVPPFLSLSAIGVPINTMTTTIKGNAILIFRSTKYLVAS